MKNMFENFFTYIPFITIGSTIILLLFTEGAISLIGESQTLHPEPYSAWDIAELLIVIYILFFLGAYTNTKTEKKRLNNFIQFIKKIKL